MSSLAALVECGLLYVVVPIWLLAGLADFSCHRIMRIEANAGIRESLLHLLMLAQLGVAALCPLFLDLTTATFTVMLVACLAHEATTCVDLAYAESHRHIPWYEQWVHGLQQALPWAWLTGWMLVQAPQALALFGMGDAAAVWELRPRTAPLSAGYLISFFMGGLILVWGPFIYEFWRCWRMTAALRPLSV